MSGVTYLLEHYPVSQRLVLNAEMGWWFILTDIVWPTSCNTALYHRDRHAACRKGAEIHSDRHLLRPISLNAVLCQRGRLVLNVEKGWRFILSDRHLLWPASFYSALCHRRRLVLEKERRFTVSDWHLLWPTSFNSALCHKGTLILNVQKRRRFILSDWHLLWPTSFNSVLCNICRLYWMKKRGVDS